jgi:hypothetical protein
MDMRYLLLIFPVILLGCSEQLDQMQNCDNKLHETLTLHGAVVKKSAELWTQTEASRYALENAAINSDIERFLDTFDEEGRLVAIQEDGTKAPISKKEVMRIIKERDKRMSESLLNHARNVSAIENLKEEAMKIQAAADAWHDDKLEMTEKLKKIQTAGNTALNVLISSGAMGVMLGTTLP